MLIGEWNGHGFYQLSLKPVTDLEDGYKWSTVDMINGGSHGYETSPVFAGASTNFAMYEAIQPGWNEVSIFPYLMDASNNDIVVLVKKESEIIATSWRRAFFEVETDAEVGPDTIDLRIEGENLGWGVPGLSIRAIVFREDGSRRVHNWSLGTLEPLGSIEFIRSVPNDAGAPVLSVIVELNWESGRQVFQAWPKETEPPWYTWPVFRSSVGSMIALVVVWVGAPMLFQAWRDTRRSRPLS